MSHPEPACDNKVWNALIWCWSSFSHFQLQLADWICRWRGTTNILSISERLFQTQTWDNDEMIPKIFRMLVCHDLHFLFFSSTVLWPEKPQPLKTRCYLHVEVLNQGREGLLDSWLLVVGDRFKAEIHIFPCIMFPLTDTQPLCCHMQKQIFYF